MIDSRVILSAGMPRSGSTWLFNAVRIVLAANEVYQSGWVGDFKEFECDKKYLNKCHEFNTTLLQMSDYVFYSFRDIRDVVASLYRKFKVPPSMDNVHKFIEDHSKWADQADLVMRYESMIEDPISFIEKIIFEMQVSNLNGDTVSREIEKLNYAKFGLGINGYNKKNLLHRGHKTDGRHGSWSGILDQSFLEEFENQYSAWLKENNYPVLFSHRA